jgi:hypothetical protein
VKAPQLLNKVFTEGVDAVCAVMRALNSRYRDTRLQAMENFREC